jgi:predicted phosphodiesterase
LRIGILADSHGRVDILESGIETLSARKVDRLIHLGDMMDTLRPETVDTCVKILIENNIEGVLGNHEYSYATHHFKRYPEKFSESAMEYVSSFPYLIEIADVCFTHFSPEGGVHGLYAHTDEESYRTAIMNSRWAVLINGHSHDPRIYCRRDGKPDDKPEVVEFESGVPFRLRDDAQYILTCGALEDDWCAIYDFEKRAFEIISLKD